MNRLEHVLTPEEEQWLLKLARDTIVAAVAGDTPAVPSESELTPGLRQHLGAFVTLYRHGEVRGCIGRMEFDRPLYRNLIDAAVSSALHDPRFPAAAPEEIPGLRIEISALNEPMPVAGPDDFDPLQHGIVIEIGYAHGIFLPKVAREYGWDRPTTLMMLCRKIGLPDDAWKSPQTRFKIYYAHEFGEKSEPPDRQG